MQTYLTQLIPQNQISDLNNELEKLMGQTYKYAKIVKLDESDWLPFIEKHMNDTFPHISEDYFEHEDQSRLVNWFQEDNFITITIPLQKQDITVDEKHVESSLLKGLWWNKISSITIDEEIEGITQISFETTGEWPVLIKGGNPDPLSCYALSVLCLAGNTEEWHKMSLMWIRHASILGNHSAVISYGTLLASLENYGEAIHWLCRAIISYEDPICSCTLASVLLNPGNKEFRRPQLAEFVLCRLCLQGVPQAFFLLGRLYYNGAEGVQRMEQKGLDLLTVAATRYDDAEAQELLSRVTTLQEEELKEEKEKTEQNEEGTSLLDFTLAGVIIAGVALAGAMLFRRLSRK